MAISLEMARLGAFRSKYNNGRELTDEDMKMLADSYTENNCNYSLWGLLSKTIDDIGNDSRRLKKYSSRKSRN